MFDTCNVWDGAAYGLTMHLNRLAQSAQMARIGDFDKERYREIILQTIAATGLRNDVFVRYWLSAGRGDFSVSPSGCKSGPLLYVVVHEDKRKTLSSVSAPPGFKGPKPTVPLEVSAVSSVLPLKPPLLANMKSTNYLLNALIQMEAEDQGANLAIQVAANGVVAESSVSCVVAVGKDGIMRVPEPQFILPSITIQRLLDLAPQLKDRGIIAGVERCDFMIQDMEDSAELIDVGGGWCRAVVSLDGNSISKGVRGPVFEAVWEMLIDDFSNKEFTDAIPYSD